MPHFDLRAALASGALTVALLAPAPVRAEVDEVRIPVGAGGVGFLTLLMMEKHGLVDKHAKALGHPGLKVKWVNVGGPAQVNDALLSGNAHVAPGGPPGFLTLWAKTRDNLKVMGVGAMTSMPMYLNTKIAGAKSARDLKATDRIGVTAIKVSIPAIILQMYARKALGPEQTFHFDPMTVTITHPDGVAALLSGKSEINYHFTSPPFHQRERRDPAVRTLLTTTEVMEGSTTFTMLYAMTRFRDENPKTLAAIIAALEAANALINRDRRAAAEVYLDSVGRKGWSAEEILAVLDDPEVKYTSTPENVMRYANFMADIGTLKHRPAGLGDLFFPEAHTKGGN